MLLDPKKIITDAIAARDDRGGEITYGELVEQGRLVAEAAQPRSVVFCLCENVIGSLLGYIGLYDNGIVPLLLDASLNRELLAHLLKVYTPAYLWLPEKYEEEFKFPALYRAHGYALISTGIPVYEVHSDLSMLMTTSGSTGSPKLVRHKYGNIEANARNVAIAFGWTAEERAICLLPMQYTMGLNVINTHLYVGATVLLCSENLTSPKFWKFIKEERGSNFTGVPYSYNIFFKLRFQQMELPHLTTLAVGGGKMTEKNFKEMAAYANATGKRFISSFGTTETSARMACLQPEYAQSKCCSIGKAIPEGELFLRNESGEIIEDSEASGELCYRGPNVTMGYAESREDLLLGDVFCGEYRTGDLAQRDAEGFYTIVGRLKRFVKLYGLRISLDQCEQLVNDAFSCECACCGTDTSLSLYVTNKNICKEVKAFVCKTLQILPVSVKVIHIDEIPKSDSGKIRYADLQ